MTPRRRHRTHFGRTELPEELQGVLRRARWLELITIGYMLSVVAVIYLVMGSSQAMRAAFVEDLLALIPPTSFLIAARVAASKPDRKHPYGRHRAVAVGHLVSAVALLSMGVLLSWESASGLLRQEHPPVGTLQVLGQTVWAGWLMIAALAYSGIGPIILGRLKKPLAEQLHDKVLHADADMNKADWMTAGAGIVGILGIGMGLWWADAAAALVISLSILKDGVSNVRAAVAGLTDTTARTVDDRHEHPLVRQIEDYLDSRPWVAAHQTRVRDLGHVFHVEVRVVPRGGELDLDRLRQATEDIRALDWKLDDVTVAAVPAVEVVRTAGRR